MNGVLVTPLFEEKKESLHAKLAAVSENRQEESGEILHNFLEGLLGQQSEFKRKLPDPERFLINSVLAFAKAQGDLWDRELPSRAEPIPTKISIAKSQPFNVSEIARDGVVALAAVILAASGIGWGVLGVGLGLAAGKTFRSMKNIAKPRFEQSPVSAKPAGLTIDMQQVADQTVTAVANLCHCFDEILKTYRIQMANLTYREEKHFESQNRLLLARIQTILGLVYVANPENADDVRDLLAECRNLEAQLSNEGLRVVKYTQQIDKREENYFHFFPSLDVDAPVMELPAITRGEVPILPGKVFVPKP